MVRRGGRGIAASSFSNHSRWNNRSSRPNSANESEIGSSKASKSSDSTRSSPIIASQSVRVTSPTTSRKSVGSRTRGAFWRSRGSPRHNSSGSIMDPKFSISNEDFPALPGVRGNHGSNTAHSSPITTSTRKAKDSGNESTRPLSVTSGEAMSYHSNDDSGVSSGSRGHTPQRELDESEQKKPKLINRKSSSSGKEKDSPSSPRGNLNNKTSRNGHFSSSPKKKGANTTAVCPPSFIKLPKPPQKQPERRGGVHTTPRSSTQLQSPQTRVVPPTLSKMVKKDEEEEMSRNLLETPSKETNGVDGDGVVVEKKAPTEAELLAIEYEYIARNTPRIIVGPDGHMSNIPPTMLTDQFGMAAMLPVLTAMKSRNQIPPNETELEKTKREMLMDQVDLTSIGFDLSELGVPTKHHDNQPIYPTFAGPFGRDPLNATNVGLMSCQAPSIYYTAKVLSANTDMNQGIPEKFGDAEFFYMFYNMPREVWQMNAARELQYRGWRFHKREKFWCLKREGDLIDLATLVSPKCDGKIDNVLAGRFFYYNPQTGEYATREMRLNRSDFEIPEWDQVEPSADQKSFIDSMPRDALWGPNAREKMKHAENMHSRSQRLSNNSNPRQPPSRRLLSFADEQGSSSSSSQIPSNNQELTKEQSDMLRQQHVYASVLQKMQQMHVQQTAAARNSSASVPFFST